MSASSRRDGTDRKRPETTLERAVELAGRDTGPMHAGYEKYRLGHEIGRGGMGLVFSAVDSTLRRELAVKVLQHDDNENARIAFIEEAQITGQLEHPNIVPVHEIGNDPQGRPYMAMKRVRGATFAQVIHDAHTAMARCETEAAVEAERRKLLDVFVKVCEAIAYAHNRGVIHRDLKPDNVMVGKFGEVQVMDWGLAKPIGSADREFDGAITSDRREQQGANVTMQGKVMGTPAYMAPEQASGRTGQLDEGADIYALGGILYTMLTNELPFDGESDEDLVAQVLEQHLVPPSQRTPEINVPRELEAVVMKAMARRRRDRYASALDLIADIRRYLSGHTLVAADYSPWQLLLKWVGRNKALVFGAAATGVAAFIGLIAVILVINEAEIERIKDQERTRQETQAQAERAAREQAVTDATAHYETATAEWAEIEARVPFNPAAPQTYFQARLPVALKMGRALQTHPPPPPVQWRTALAEICATMQENAQAVGDWAMARHLADSAEFWGAIAAADHRTRVAAVERAFEAQKAGDLKRLNDVLQLIRHAETRPPESGGFAPGEFEERARALARQGGPGFTEVLLQHIVDDLDAEAAEATGNTDTAFPSSSTARLTRVQRQFLIDTLGRRGDIITSYKGWTAPKLVKAGFERVAEDWKLLDELRRWTWAGVRLEAVFAGAYARANAKTNADDGNDDPAVPPADLRADILAAATAFDHTDMVRSATRQLRDGTPAEVGPAMNNALAAVQYLDVIRGEAALPVVAPDAGENPFLDADQYVRLVDHLGDWVAGSAKSGSAYTQTLLDLAGDDTGAKHALSTRQQAFVLDQLGLHGDVLPPRISQRRINARDVLLAAFRAPSDEELAAQFGDQIGLETEAERAVWFRKRVRAAAASRSLARLARSVSMPTGFVQEFYYRRAAADTLFRERTRTAFRLLSLDEWPAPRTSGQAIERARAHLEMGDLESLVADAERALALHPRSVEAHQLIGEAHFLRAEFVEAHDRFAQALSVLEPNASARVRAKLLVQLGQTLEARNETARAIELYTEAATIAPHLADAFAARAHAYCYLLDLNRSLADCNRALELDLHRSDVWIVRGIVWATNAYYATDAEVKQESVRTALDDFDSALRIAPTSSEAYFNRGSARLSHLRDNGGLGDLMEALRLDPSLSNQVTGLELMRLVGTTDLRGALARLRTAMDEADRDTTDWLKPLVLGAIWRRLQNEQQSTKYFNMAIGRAPWRFRLGCEMIRIQYR